MLLTKEAIIQILSSTNQEEQQQLFLKARQAYQDVFGNQIHLRGLIEISNYCGNDCLYCGLRCSNSRIYRYAMPPEEIIATAKQAISLGYKTIVLQAGESSHYSAAELAEIVTTIKKSGTVAITLSLGCRSFTDYEMLRSAGADRYLMRHETADPVLFAKLRPGTMLEERLQNLKALRKLGYQIGAGFMVGVPGQTLETLADDLLLLQKLNVDMAGIGPFIPHEDTPLHAYPAGDFSLSLRVLALARLLLPYTHLPATTAMGSLHPQGYQLALACGANVVMPNLTPLCYRQLYQIYPNKASSARTALETHDYALSLLKREGKTIAKDLGHSLVKQRSEVK